MSDTDISGQRQALHIGSRVQVLHWDVEARAPVGLGVSGAFVDVLEDVLVLDIAGGYHLVVDVSRVGCAFLLTEGARAGVHIDVIEGLDGSVLRNDVVLEVVLVPPEGAAHAPHLAVHLRSGPASIARDKPAQ